MICGETEEGTGRMCDKEAPCYIQHETDGEGWGVAPTPPARGSRRKQADEIAGNVEVQHPVGAPVIPIVTSRSPQPVSDDSMIPDNPEWVTTTLRVFYSFLLNRGTSFTTPEDFWPVVDAPPEMRAMARVVQAAIKDGWIEEVGAKRLRGTYSSKDGRTFKMNKLVSIYVSRIFSLEVASSGPG